MKRKIDFLEIFEFLASIKVLYIVMCLSIVVIFFTENKLTTEDINLQIDIHNNQSKLLNLQIVNLDLCVDSLKVESNELIKLLEEIYVEPLKDVDSLDIKLIEQIKYNYNKEFNRVQKELEILDHQNKLLSVNEERLKVISAKNKTTFWYFVLLIIGISTVYRETLKLKKY